MTVVWALKGIFTVVKGRVGLCSSVARSVSGCLPGCRAGEEWCRLDSKETWSPLWPGWGSQMHRKGHRS